MHCSRPRFRLLLTAAIATCLVATAWASADTVKLKSGASLQGKVLKQSEKTVWLDVGPNVLEFSMDDVDTVELAEVKETAQVQSDSLYHTATNLRELPPKEQAKRIGSAVIKVSTPSDLRVRTGSSIPPGPSRGWW